jgi:hypothetical protein
VSYLPFVAFLFAAAELVGVFALDELVLMTGLKVLDVRGQLAVEMQRDQATPGLRGFKVRAFPPKGYLLRPVSYFEKGPSADPLVTGIAHLEQVDGGWRLRAYQPVGKLVFFAAMGLWALASPSLPLTSVATWVWIGIGLVVVLGSERIGHWFVRNLFARLLHTERARNDGAA